MKGSTTLQPSVNNVEAFRAVVAVATYKRAEQLKVLLDSLSRATNGCAVDVIVVDNDIDESGRNCVNQISWADGRALLYVVEPRPGIASARNRALKEFGEEYDGIIFVDDDEWVDGDWYTNLIECALSSCCGAVTGPVISVLPASAPDWIVRGGFYQRPILKTGTKLRSAATNNTLLLRSAWKGAGFPEFDEQFSTTGGSDWDFFWGIRRSGAEIVFCSEAVVSEEVPNSRLSLKWITQRGIRNGIVEVRVWQKHGEKIFVPMLRSVLRATYYTARLPLESLTRRSVPGKSYKEVMVELGKVLGVFGFRIHEYKR